MTTIVRLRTDEEARVHVERDVDAVLDCFTVSLEPLTNQLWPVVIAPRDGVSMDQLFLDAKAALLQLRAQPRPRFPARSDWEPYGVITARNSAEVCSELDLSMSMLMAEVHPDHMARVRACFKALDILHGVSMRNGQGTFPPLRH